MQKRLKQMIRLAQCFSLTCTKSFVIHYQCGKFLLSAIRRPRNRQLLQHRQRQPFGVGASSDIEESSFVELECKPRKLVMEFFRALD